MSSPYRTAMLSGLELAVAPGLSGNLRITCSDSELAPPLAAGPSTPPANIRRAFSTVSPLKRKRRDMTTDCNFGSPPRLAPLHIPATPHRPSPVVQQGATQSPTEPPAPPSPAPTEIICPTPTQEELVDEARALGVKVRDFAYEPHAVPPAAEVWRNPLHTLVLHDRYIRAAPSAQAAFRLSGKLLRRLLAAGWVTAEEARRHWRAEDWALLRAYDARRAAPHPFVCVPATPKPTRDYRTALRLETYGSAPDDVPEDEIYMPPDEPGMYSGPRAEDSPSGASDVRADKRRRTGADEGRASAGPSSQPLARRATEPAENPPSPPRPSSPAAPAPRHSSPASDYPPTEPATPAGSDVTPPPTPAPGPAPRRPPARLGRTQTLLRI
ncbi:hypothetical protein OBBRIDRAFT_835074 [Obba rivulosa]|uniref:Uncharacterized protein n=1 Tax=Obba rivulosa TaxID=1052685 RepID=A0A8E2AU45_9APHY|nr:hypothetical protein OBBRIDRAFT_835074 [Obba rivulosa]